MRKLKTFELGRKSAGEYQNSPKLPVVVILDNLRSMHNVGAVFRTSDAFLIKKVFLCGITACPPHRQIRKSALGAEETVEWEYFDSTKEAAEKCRAEGFHLTGIEQTDDSIGLHEFPWKKHESVALVFGNEVDGLSPEILPLLNDALEIPMEGTKHSLNVGVTTGIVLWECYSALRK